MADKTQSIDETLAVFGAAFKGFEKDASNPHFKSKYVTLDALFRAIKPALVKAGLYLSQWTSFEDGTTLVHTRITNVAGDSREGVLPLILEKSTSQGLGSALTYNRKYGACTILLLVEMDDDDGNAAERVGLPAAKVMDLEKLIKDSNAKRDDVLLYVKNTYKVDAIDKLTRGEAENVANMLRTKIQQSGA